MVNPLFEASSQGQSLASPKMLAALAARTARPGTAKPTTPVEPIQETPEENQEPGVMSKIGGAALNTVAAVGNILDLPGSSIRDTLSGKNPFDQWLDPMGRNASENRVSGRDMLRRAGVVSAEDNWKNFIGGIGLEIALDPTTYMVTGALSRAGNAFRNIGVNAKKIRPLAKEMAEVGSGSAGGKAKASTWIGGKVAAFTQTPKQVLAHAENLLAKRVKPSVDGTIEGTFKEATGDSIAFSSKDELDKMLVEETKSAWAMVDDGGKLEVYKNPKESTEWKIDPEATRLANQAVSQTVMGATSRQLRKKFIDAHKHVYGKGKTEAEYAKLLDSDMDSPLRSLVSVGLPFMHPAASLSAPNPEKRWENWLNKQPDLPEANVLEGGPPPSNLDIPPSKPRPPKDPAVQAAEAAGMSAAQEEAAARTKITPAEGKSVLKQLGKTDMDIDAIGDENIIKEVSRYGLLDSKGEVRQSIGENSKRVLFQAAKIFGPAAATAFPVIEAMAKTWAKLNNVADPDEYFKRLAVETGDVPADKLGKWTGTPDQVITEAGTQKIMRMGERVITAMKGVDGNVPTVSTFMHEVGHDARAMFDSTMQKKMEDAVGKYMLDNKIKTPLLDDTGRWTVEAEEIFANGFEAYLATGKAPVAGLRSVYQKLKDWITDIWGKIKGDPKLESYVHPQLKQVFDEMIKGPPKAKGAKGSVPVSAAANAADAVDGQAGDAAAGAKPLPPDQGGGGSSGTVEAQRSEMDQSEIDRMMKQGLTEEEAVAINNRSKESATKWANQAEQFTQPQQVDDVIKKTSQAPAAATESATDAAQVATDIDPADVAPDPDTIRTSPADTTVAEPNVSYTPTGQADISGQVDDPLVARFSQDPAGPHAAPLGTKINFKAIKEAAAKELGVNPDDVLVKNRPVEGGLEYYTELKASAKPKAQLPQEIKPQEITVYHGTNAEFDEFKDTGTTYSFSTDKGKAGKYSESRARDEGGSPRVMERKVVVNKVFDTSNPEDMAKIEAIRGEPITEIEQLQVSHLDDLKSMGYDAIKHNDEIQVFDRSQIKKPKKAPLPQENPLADLAQKAEKPKVPESNAIQEAAKEPTPIKEIPYSKNQAHNKELNRIHQSLAKTVGDDAAKAITPLVQEFVEAGNSEKVLTTTIESMSPEEMAGLAAKIAADKDGAANELLQIAYHGTPHVFGPEMLVRMPDGSEKYLKAGEAIPEGAEAVQNFPLGRFDLSRVSTGEGRGVEGAGQAYGFGAYAAQREGLARDYKKTLAGDKPSKWTYKGEDGDSQLTQQILDWLNKTNASVQQVTERMRNQLEAKASLARKMFETQYKVIESIDSAIKSAESPSSWSSISSQSGKKEYASTSGFSIRQREGGDGWVAQHSSARSVLNTGSDVESLKKWADSEGVAEAIERLRERKAATPDNYKPQLEEIEAVAKDLKKLESLKSSDFKKDGPGALYKLDVPEDEDVMFWDKPFSEQPPKVQEGLKKLGIENKTATWQPSMLDDRFGRDDEVASVFQTKKDWVDDPRSDTWTLGDKLQGASHGLIRKLFLRKREGTYYAMSTVNGQIERNQFNSLRDAKSWIDEQDHGWEAWIQSDKSYRITEKRAFKNAEDAKKWADETYPPAQLKGEDIYEQLMGQAKRDASKSEVAVKAINEVKNELKELYSDNPGIADALTDAVDNAMATVGQRIGTASSAVTKVLPSAMQPGELRASGNWDFWNKLSPILQKLDETESKLVLSDFQAKKAASKKLLSVGIKGNAVPENFRAGGNRKGNYNFVVFDDKDIKILDRLEQAGKGSVTFKETGEAAIKIVTGEGDASTAVHELAHVFRRNLKAELSERAEKALEQQLKDKDTIKNILGSKSDAVLKDANGNWTREAEEVWARLFEKYIREGKAPTNALKEAFEVLKKMMVNVYKTLAKNPEINGKINPELRAVFDEMLGGAKKIDAPKKPGVTNPIAQASEIAAVAKAAPPVSAADEFALRGDLPKPRDLTAATDNPLMGPRFSPGQMELDFGDNPLVAKQATEIQEKIDVLNELNKTDSQRAELVDTEEFLPGGKEVAAKSPGKGNAFKISKRKSIENPLVAASKVANNLRESNVASRLTLVDKLKTINNNSGGYGVLKYESKGSENIARDIQAAIRSASDEELTKLASEDPARFIKNISKNFEDSDMDAAWAGSAIAGYARQVLEKRKSGLARESGLDGFGAYTAKPRADSKIPKVKYESSNPVEQAAKEPKVVEKRISSLDRNSLVEAAAPKPPMARGPLARRAEAPKVDQAAVKKNTYVADNALDTLQGIAATTARKVDNAADTAPQYIKDAESILGKVQGVGRLVDINSLPPEKKAIFEEMLGDASNLDPSEIGGFKKMLQEAAESAAGRQLSVEEIQKVSTWLGKTSEKFQSNMARMDSSFDYITDKVREATKGAIAEKMGVLSKANKAKKRGAVSLTQEEVQNAIDGMGSTKKLFEDGADLSADSIRKSIKESTGVDLSDNQTELVRRFMTHDDKGAAKLRQEVMGQMKRSGFDDVDVGGAPKKERAPYVGGKALEEMPLSESVGNISKTDILKAMPGASEEKVASILAKLGDSGVAIIDDPAAVADEAIEEAVDIRAMYQRMNALKMLAGKTGDEDIAGLVASVKNDIAKYELERAQKTVRSMSWDSASKQDDAMSMINSRLAEMIDNHDFMKNKEIQAKSFGNIVRDAYDESKMKVGSGENAKEINRFGDIGDETISQNFEANIVDKSKLTRELFKSAPTPAAAAAAKITHEYAKAPWGDIINHIKGEDALQTLMQAMDVGGTLIAANPATRTMLRLFDAEVMGTGTMEEQDLARNLYRAYERSVYSFREIMHPIVHYTGRSNIFNQKQIAIDLMKNKNMDRVDALREAGRIANERNSEMRKFLEFDEATANDGLPYKLDRKIFDQPEEEVARLETWLRSVGKLLEDALKDSKASGLSSKQLVDEMIKYAPRSLADPGQSVLQKKSNMSLLDASQDSQIARDEHLKNLPSGTAVLDTLSLDEAISGIAYDQKILGEGLDKGTMDYAVEYLKDNYLDQLLSKKYFDEAGEITEEGTKKLQRIASTIANLPKSHVEQQIPMYGNNFLRDLSMYFENNYLKQSVALAAQGLAIRNITSGGDQKYLLSKLFSSASMDNHTAYMNVIRKTGRLGDYQNYVKSAFKDWEKQEKIFVKPDGMIEFEKRTLSPEQLAEEQMFAKKYADEKEIGVSKETFEAANYWLQGFMRPQELTVMKQIAATMLNAFKSMVTVPFPSFHGRNKTSGWAMNFFFGAKDPTAPIWDAYTKTERQAFSLRNGQPVKNIHQELPDQLVQDILGEGSKQSGIDLNSLTPEKKDAIVTDWVRSQVFKFGLVGDRMGVAAERIGDTVSSLVSQSPGTITKDKNNWFGFKNPLTDPTATTWQKLNPTAFGGAPYPTLDKTGARPKVDIKTYDETTNVIGAAGSEFGAMVEETNRVSPFLAYLKQGMSPEEAARMTHMVQFDYSRLTNFEKTLKQFIPFYVFASKALKLTVTDLLTNPGGKQAWSIRAAARAQDTEEPMPEHIRRGLAIPLGKGEDGESRYISGLGLAWEDPLEMLSFIHGDGKATATAAFTKLRPEAQALGEMAFGRSAFFDRGFNDMDPQLGRLRDNLTGNSGKGLAEPLMGSQSLEFLVGKTPATRVVSTANKAFDDRKNTLEKFLNLATGVQITDVNAEAAQRIRLNELNEQLKDLGGRELRTTYIPDWKKERMSQEETKRAEDLKRMINAINSEVREKKKLAQVQSLRSAAEGGGE